MQSRASAPKRHHVNPQVILKEFADNNERILVVSKHGAAPRLQHISNTSVVKHANTLRTSSGPDTSLETALSQIEGHYPEALRFLDLASRTPDQDALILSLIVTQAARNPVTRLAFFSPEVERIYAALRHALLEYDPTMPEEAIAAEIDHYGRHHIVARHVTPTPENVAVAGTPWLIKNMYEDLAPYRLTVIRSARGAFITADCPISVFPENVPEPDEGAFLEDTELLIPITPRHAVLISAIHALPQMLEADRSLEAVVNARTAKAGFREVYCAPGYSVDELARHLGGWWAAMPLLRLLV